MKTIQPFIDIGFYTVPLQGKLERLEDGKKTTPKFPKNWKSKYQDEFNEEATEIGGALTGAISNIIAIDCDSQVTFDMFKSLDPDNQFIFLSKGKPKGGGTIIYRYPHIVDGTPPIQSFSIQDKTINLDFYSDNGFVYLPTNSNKSKVAWKDVTSMEEMPEIKEAPETVMTLLKSFYSQYLLSQAPRDSESIAPRTAYANYLAPQIELMLAKAEFIPQLFKVLTPKDFRTLEEYVQKGYLHPKNVPDGRGSEYLSKVSAILGADPSISPNLYTRAIFFINDLWEQPIKKDRLEQTIIDPMINLGAKINGTPIWTYDEDWSKKGMTFTTKFGEAAEVFFDDVKALYYMINTTTGNVRAYARDGDIYSYMTAVGLDIPARKEFLPLIPLVRTVSDPGMAFGFYSKDTYTREFNLFQQSPALKILNEPETYKEFYKRPETIINFFNSLVPDPFMRNYLLKFLKRKLLTFNYSPVVLYFLGKHGSGKDTLVNILAEIIGDSYVGRPTTKEFLEQYNGWLMDKYFAHLDEYGNQLSRLSDKEEALGKLKYYTGKRNIQIRQMRVDGLPYKHNITFIMTANSNPLILEDGDRRAAFFNTPNVLKDEEWVVKTGGMEQVYKRIMSEINDFCYYLATEVDDMHPDDYLSPPVTEQKHKLISSMLPAASRLAYYFKNHMFLQLYKTCKEWDIDINIFDHAAEGKIYEDDLFELYLHMTDHAGQKRGLSAALRDAGYDKIPTTRNGQKAYYYKVNELKFFSLPDGGFPETPSHEVEL